jgi:hypothetical protein
LPIGVLTRTSRPAAVRRSVNRRPPSRRSRCAALRAVCARRRS